MLFVLSCLQLRAFVDLVRNFADMNGFEPEYMNPDEFSTIHLNRPEALRARTERQLVRLWNDCGRALLADGADAFFQKMTTEVRVLVTTCVLVGVYVVAM